MADENSEEASTSEFKFSSYEAAESFISDYEKQTGTKYIKRKSRKEQIQDFTSLEGKRPLIGENCVYIKVYDDEVRECHHGQRRCKISKSKRMRYQNTKKMDCPAKIIVQTALLYPDFEISKTSPRRKKAAVLKRFRSNFEDNPPKKEICVTVKVMGHHVNHEIGEGDDFNMMLDPEINKFIKEKLDEGVSNVDDILSRIQDLPMVKNSSSTNRRYHPSRRTVYNIVYNYRNLLRPTKDDSMNTKIFLEEKAALGGNVYYRPALSPDNAVEDGECGNGLLVIYQSSFQCELMKKYSEEVVLLDSTYNFCNFSVPLYMVAVQTNVGFVVVASFIIGRDTKEQISEALQKIKSSNLSWNPKYFLTDYDFKEIGAIETVFPESRHFLCHFHVIQGWKRWLQKDKDLSTNDRAEILKLLRNICKSETKEELVLRVEAFKSTTWYTNNTKLRGWLETRWFPESKRWVDCYRQEMKLRSDTNNAIEVQHREFKRTFLRKEGIGGSIENVVQTLVNKYLPNMELRYKEINKRAQSTSKLYSPLIPGFLINRPPKLVQHCMKRMPPKINEIKGIEPHPAKSDTFIVNSESGLECYEVSFSNMVPECACPDFRKTHWPCKHLLAIINSEKKYGWDKINKSYTEQPCFCLDIDVEDTTESDKFPATPNIDHTYCVGETSTPLTERSTLVNTRKKFIEETQKMTEQMYCVDNVEIIERITKQIQVINDELKQQIPTLKKIPLRRKRRSSMPPVREKKIRRTRRNPVVEEMAFVEFGHDLNPSLGEITNDTLSSFGNEDPHEKALKEILLRRSGEELVMEVGPYKLTCESFQCLKTELADEMIDAYLSLLVRGKNVYHLCCSTATDIFYSGQEILHGYLRNTLLSNYDYILGAVNQGHNHWILVIIVPAEKKLIIIDPLCSEDRHSNKYLVNWEYWGCDRCDGWFHPSCVGETTEPEIYICPMCRKKEEEKRLEREELEKEKKSRLEREDLEKDERYIFVRGKPLFLQEPDDEETDNDDKENEEDDQHIIVESDSQRSPVSSNLFQHFQTIIEDLKDTVNCSNKQCKIEEHYRHHRFCQSFVKFLHETRNLEGFGNTFFKEQDEDALNDKLIKELHISKPDPTRSTGTARITTLNIVDNGTMLDKVLSEHKLFAINYIFLVLQKDYMTRHVAIEKGWPLEMVEQQCAATEVICKRKHR